MMMFPSVESGAEAGQALPPLSHRRRDTFQIGGSLSQFGAAPHHLFTRTCQLAPKSSLTTMPRESYATSVCNVLEYVSASAVPSTVPVWRQVPSAALIHAAPATSIPTRSPLSPASIR